MTWSEKAAEKAAAAEAAKNPPPEDGGKGKGKAKGKAKGKVGLYLIVTSQHIPATLYQVSYRTQSLFF
jgi:hypothetical protein